MLFINIKSSIDIKYRVFGLISCLLLILSSCKKNILDPVPRTSISDLNSFDNPERILAQIHGLYSGVKSSQLFGGRYTIYQEIRADEFIMNKPNVQTGQITWGHNVNSSTSEVQNMWSAAYGAINRINVFLEGLETNKQKIAPDLLPVYTGEAKLLRALCYFVLVQQYARPFVENQGAGLGLPLRLAAEKSSENNDLARSSVKQVYDQIIVDLDEAEQGLPLRQSSASLNITRAHRNTAIALKTRVYLTMGNFEKVKQEAGKIVSATAPYQAATGVNHKLAASVATVFVPTYTGEEAILFLPMSSQDAPGGQNALSYYFTFTPGNAEYYLNTNGILTDPVFGASSTDARKALVVQQQNLMWLYKFKQPSPYTDYIPVIRYAEVLLNYSEALARTGSLTQATDILNAVRKRSDPSYNFPADKVSTQAALVSTILHERRIELMGEGFRVPDLQRTLQPLPGKLGPAGSSPAVATSESRYIWPIPASELSTNRLIEPNP